MPLQRAHAARWRALRALLVAREKREWICRSAMKFIRGSLSWCGESVVGSVGRICDAMREALRLTLVPQ